MECSQIRWVYTVVGIIGNKVVVVVVVVLHTSESIVYLPLSKLIFPIALKDCRTTFGSSLSRFDKMVDMSPALTQGTLVSSKKKIETHFSQ